MAVIRHTALNRLSRAKPSDNLKTRRKRAGWNVDYLETVIPGRLTFKYPPGMASNGDCFTSSPAYSVDDRQEALRLAARAEAA